MNHRATGVKTLHVSGRGSYTKEQLEKMLTEWRELTLMCACAGNSGEAKMELKRPGQSALRQRGDSGDTTIEWKGGARPGTRPSYGEATLSRLRRKHVVRREGRGASRPDPRQYEVAE